MSFFGGGSDDQAKLAQAKYRHLQTLPPSDAKLTQERELVEYLNHTKNWTLYHMQNRLRIHGWQVPAYPLPDNMSDQIVQRIVVRNGMNRSLACALLDDIKKEVDFLDSLNAPIPHAKHIGAFAH